MLSLYPRYVDVVKTIKDMEEEKKKTKTHKHKSHTQLRMYNFRLHKLLCKHNLLYKYKTSL